MDTIFMKIIRGEIPSYRLYEDEHSFAFLDINPYSLWHTLIVPKVPIDHFFDLEEPYYTALFHTAKKLAPALQKATGALRIWLVIEGLEVPHVHIKLIPINKAGDLDSNRAHFESDDAMLAVQQKIINNLKQ